MPWIIVDSKRDDLIAEIENLEEIRIDKKPPSKRGLYVVRPKVSEMKDGTATGFLYDVWRNEETGLFFDEGYSFDRFDPGIQTIFTQGRSKHIPVIALSQKPAWVSPFWFSESEYKSVFYLDMPADLERIREWMPARTRDPVTGGPIDPYALPDHHSYWRYKRDISRVGPCEGFDAIKQRFANRMPRRRWF